MIEVKHLSKRYGEIQALHQVSFTIERGEIVGLLGPNGAGKTTLMKILTGYLQPDEGSARIGDLDVVEQRIEVQKLMGYLPENAPLYHDLSVQGYLGMMAELRQLTPEAKLPWLSAAVYATGLEDHLVRPIGELSKGYRQRVGLAQAILHRPELMILDEPTVGLDPTQIVEIRALIRRLAQHSTILLSTHILSEVEQVCDRVLILMNGEIRADAKLSDLAGSANAVLVLQHADPDVLPLLEELPGVGEVKRSDSRDGYPLFSIMAQETSDQETDLTPLVYALAKQHDWPVREIRRDIRTLETIFNDLATAVTETSNEVRD